MEQTKRKEKKAVDLLFEKYSKFHQHPGNKLIHWICIPLIMFGIIGLVSAIPFPYISFLGKYNMYINWFSFLLAGSIYYYLRLSPLLSYLMLFVVAFMYYFIVQLEQVEKAGGPALWQVSLAIFLLALVGRLAGYRLEGKRPSFPDNVKFLLIGPIWLLHFILKRLRINY